MVDNFATTLGQLWTVLQVSNEMDSVDEAEWLVPVNLGAPTTDLGAPTTPLQQDLLVPACQPGDALAWLGR